MRANLALQLMILIFCMRQLDFAEDHFNANILKLKI